MSKKGLRITGGCLIGCALLTYWMWHNSFNQIAPVEQDFILQRGQTVSLAFTPVLEEAPYTVSLTFDKAQKTSLDCYTVQSSNVEWKILVINTDFIQSGNLHGPKASCNDDSEVVRIKFEIPNFILNYQHLLILSVADRGQRKIKLQSHVSISPGGIGVHYVFNDLAAKEIAMCVLLAFGLGCFFPDMWNFAFSRQTQKF